MPDIKTNLEINFAFHGLMQVKPKTDEEWDEHVAAMREFIRKYPHTLSSKKLTPWITENRLQIVAANERRFNREIRNA